MPGTFVLTSVVVGGSLRLPDKRVGMVPSCAIVLEEGWAYGETDACRVSQGLLSPWPVDPPGA